MLRFQNDSLFNFFQSGNTESISLLFEITGKKTGEESQSGKKRHLETKAQLFFDLKIRPNFWLNC